MIVYKYTGLSQERGLPNVIQALQNRELRFSSFHNQNDPMEGIFWHNSKDRDLAKSITEAKNKYAICSFGSSGKNSTLWSYYADGFRGICMGLEPDRKFSTDLIKKIEYVHSDYFSRIVKKTDPDVIALALITRKLFPWGEEREIRLLQHAEEGHIEVGKWKSLHFGRNVSMNNVNIIIPHIILADLVYSTGRFKIPVFIASPSDGRIVHLDKILTVNQLLNDFGVYHDWRSSFSN